MHGMPPRTSAPDLPPAGAVAPPADPARLFIALWPPPELAQELQAWCRAAAGPVAARCAPMARLHLTLHFLGSVPRPRLQELRAALCVPFSPFELCLRHCRRWPRGLLVAEPDGVAPELAALHAQLARALVAAGLGVEDRAFRPHVTLARRLAGQGADGLAVPAPLRWPVRSYALCESLPGRYRHVQRYPGGGERAVV